MWKEIKIGIKLQGGCRDMRYILELATLGGKLSNKKICNNNNYSNTNYDNNNDW